MSATDSEQSQAAADESVEVQDAQVPEASDQPVTSQGGQIDILLDMTLPVAVRLGGMQMPVKELLQMGPGSVVTLDRQVGEPVDLFLRDTMFAKGQLVAVGDRLGVRVTEIVSVGDPPAASD